LKSEQNALLWFFGQKLFLMIEVVVGLMGGEVCFFGKCFFPFSRLSFFLF